MSTALVTKEDYAFFDFLAPYRWPNKSAKEIADYRELVETGEIQIETLLENTYAILSQQSPHPYHRVAGVGHDFVYNNGKDAGDAKKAISQFRNNKTKESYSINKKTGKPVLMKKQWTNSIFISNLKNKTGLVRATVYSKEQDKFYFFAIPYSAYKGMKRVEIPLDTFNGVCGVPKGIPKSMTKWTQYRVADIQTVATITQPAAENLKLVEWND